MGNSACCEGFAGLAGSKPAAKKQQKTKGFKVCICGGSGGIGQQLALLMATNPLVGELSVYDLDNALVPAEGVAADLSHLEFPCSVKAYSLGRDARPVNDLPAECLDKCDLVLVVAGVPRKPGQDKRDFAHVNSNISKLMVEACAKFCPDAVVALIVNPLNSIVPAMASLYEQKGLDPRKIVGVTTLDGLRSSKFAYEVTGQLSEVTGQPDIEVPVIGGNSGKSILPLFYQACPSISLEKRKVLEARVHDAGNEIVRAKKGKGSATISLGYAGYLLGSAVLEGLSGQQGLVECAYVKSSVTELPYFASPVIFGRSGVAKVPSLPKMDDYEKQRLKDVIQILKEDIEIGLEYAKRNELA
eukprot:TRINITY_DN20002_c2_g1_i1.p1 TRINITY_DN20002_c2_g1~~TRINITY_DN20002_c2_g1_i1.p1  ORF type:complete len:358 (-),score=53.86 TRINITY_DN20002_c2_g1_i1:92-1165(-)